jgi:hypothetical protein
LISGSTCWIVTFKWSSISARNYQNKYWRLDTDGRSDLTCHKPVTVRVRMYGEEQQTCIWEYYQLQGRNFSISFTSDVCLMISISYHLQYNPCIIFHSLRFFLIYCSMPVVSTESWHCCTSINWGFPEFSVQSCWPKDKTGPHCKLSVDVYIHLLTLGSLYQIQHPPSSVSLVFKQLRPLEEHHSPWYQTFSGTLDTSEMPRPILSARPTRPIRCT